MMRGFSPLAMAIRPSSVSSLRLTSRLIRFFSLLAIGSRNRLAMPTPYTVATKATAMPPPSLDGSDRFSITWIRPSTAPRMPIVGA
ncbi:hypothetical protein D3C85_1428180 [compost metagenome]